MKSNPGPQVGAGKSYADPSDAWHVEPLRCPVCQGPMRAIAVIDDPEVVERILRHLGAWHGPPAGLSPPGASGPYTYEPCGDVDPMP